MALDFEAFIADVRANIATVWPEVKVNGIWDAEHVDRIAWLDLGLPYAVMLISPAAQYPLTMDGLTVTIDLQVYYVALSAGKSVSLRGKLVALVNALWPSDPLTEGQIVEVGNQDWSDDMPANQILRAGNQPARAGMVSFTCLVQ